MFNFSEFLVDLTNDSTEQPASSHASERIMPQTIEHSAMANASSSNESPNHERSYYQQLLQNAISIGPTPNLCPKSIEIIRKLATLLSSENADISSEFFKNVFKTLDDCKGKLDDIDVRILELKCE